MEQNNNAQQRLARLDDHDRQVLKMEMRPAQMLSLILSVVSLVWLFVFLLAFKLAWVAIIGAAIISIGNWLLERHANKKIKKDFYSRCHYHLQRMNDKLGHSNKIKCK